ncbi:TPA: phage tail tip lysozyme [Enterococcus faecium]
MFPFIGSSTEAYANFEGFVERCETVVPSSGSSGSNNSSTDSDATNGGGYGGGWKQKGTQANKNAQEMWDYWKSKGFGGKAISGVLGNVAHEGDFDIPDRAEGHYGGDQKTNGISEGVVPATGAGYPTGKTGKVEGGGGHYQFTPYSKFAPIGDSKWKSTKAQSDFVWTSEVGKATWLNDYINIGSVESAVEMWFVKYERGARLDPAKIESGKKAYEIFGGKDVSPDSALANAQDTANDGEEKSKEKKKASSECEPSTVKGTNIPASGEIVEIGKALLGYFSYLQVHGESYIGSIEKPKKSGVTDCSGFVWLVLAQAGYKAPDNMAWYTGSMESDAKKEHQWIQEIPASEAKAGDIVIVNTGDGAGSNGHTAILTEDWKDEPVASNTTGIIQMGGDPSADGVNESSFVGGFLSLVNGTYGAHTITFARGIKK